MGKAWIVREKEWFSAEVVFADSRGKAKSIAMDLETFEDARFIDLEVHRLPELDKYYVEGKVHFEWDNPKDRLVLVKECNFVCDDDTFEYEDCSKCPAKDYCDRYAREPQFCNEWNCKYNRNGYCYVADDECPNIQDFFNNRRKDDLNGREA